MSGTRGLLGWSWIFVSLKTVRTTASFTDALSQILEGIATVCVGVLALLGLICIHNYFLWYFDSSLVPVLVDFPASASFLTPEERAFVVWKKSQYNLLLSIHQSLICFLEYDNSSLGEEERFAPRHV